MLLCDNKTFYTGITDNFIERFIKHINKQNISTKKFLKIKFVYAEKYRDKYQAARREKQLKGWSHAKKQLMIDGKLGINTCTEFVEDLISKLNL